MRYHLIALVTLKIILYEENIFRQGYILCKILWWWEGGMADGRKIKYENKKKRRKLHLFGVTNFKDFASGASVKPPMHNSASQKGGRGGGGDRNVQYIPLPGEL